MKTTETIDLVFSFDTTGSMYPCLTQVRRKVEETVRELFNEIPNLRVGIITHGDYCDGAQVLTSLDLTSDKDAICRFIQNAPATSGGDEDECYELVLNVARSLHWTGGRNKALVLIGDSRPHAVGYIYDRKVNDLDWRNELQLLVEAGIQVYPVQALGRYGSESFYKTLAKNPESIKLDLLQFADVTDLLLALSYKRANKVEKVEEVLRRSSYNIRRTAGKFSKEKILTTTPADVMFDGRFQVLDVDRDCSIQDFVEENGLTFERGKGYYQFTKKETIQENKRVMAQNRATGAIHHGGNARRVLGIPLSRIDMRPKTNAYVGFIQSTSNNRKLKAGTKFLYEISDWK